MIFVFSSLFIVMDVWRQVTGYGMKYYNEGQYPVPQTGLVAVTEILKCFIFTVKLCISGTLCSCKISFKFLVPSVCYAINNNMFFLAMYYTTPPIWNILCQMRVIFTAIVYKFVFKKSFTSLQWVAMILLMTVIVMAKFSGGPSDIESQSSMFIPLIMAVVASVIAALGPVYTEVCYDVTTRQTRDVDSMLV